MTTSKQLEGGGIKIRYLVDGEASRGLGMFEMTVQPGAQVPPPHSHTETEECVYVLEGTLSYRVEQETRDLGPGDLMVTPKGQVHYFTNTTKSPVRALIIMTPDIGFGYFREMFEIFGSGGPPDMARAMRVMNQYKVVAARP
jgi:quercetin dioxygenase-like cupin family protein